MASLRAQYAQQSVRDAQGIEQTISSAKQAYDKSQLSMVQTQAQKIYSDFQNELTLSNDFNNYEAIQQKYEASMEDYLNQIKATGVVRNAWNNTYGTELKIKMNDFRTKQQERGMYTQCVANWNNKITEIGASDMSYSEKEKALNDYWNTNNVGSYPRSIVGNVTTVEQALESMKGITVQQRTDSYILSNNFTSASFNENDCINSVLSDMTDSNGNSILDESSKLEAVQIISQRIKQYETLEKNNAVNAQAQYTEWLYQNPDATEDDKKAKGAEFGAYNQEGQNRFWAGWFENSEAYFNPDRTIALRNIDAVLEDSTSTKAEYESTVGFYHNCNAITDDEFNDYMKAEKTGFYKHENYKQTESTINLALKDSLGANRKVRKLYGIDNVSYSQMDAEDKMAFDRLESRAKDYMEIAYNKNPLILSDTSSSEYQKAIDEAIKYAEASALDDNIKQVFNLSSSNYFGVTVSQNENTLEFVKPFYDMDSPDYLMYKLMTEDYALAVNRELNSTVGNVDEDKDKISQASDVFGKPYKELEKWQKETIDMLYAKYLYEYDLRESVISAFDLNSDNLIQTYVEGVGPAYFDKSNSSMYYSNGTSDSKNATSWTKCYMMGSQVDAINKHKGGNALWFTVKELKSTTVNVPVFKRRNNHIKGETR